MPITDRTLAALVGVGDHPLVRSLPPGAVFVFDQDLRYVSAAGSGLDKVELTLARLEGRTVSEVFPPAVSSTVEPLYRAALRGESSEMDVTFGGRTYCSRLSPVRDASGQIVAGMGFSQDVTDARAAERALRESEQRFRLGFNHAPIGMALLELDGRWRQVNAALTRLTGYTEAELLARTIGDLCHPEDRDSDQDQLACLIAGEIDGYELEKRYLTAAGATVWTLLSVTLVRDDDGHAWYFIAQIQDITQRRTQEVELQRVNRFAQAVLAASPDVIHVRHVEDASTAWSSRPLVEVLGHSPEDTDGGGRTTVEDLVCEEDQARYHAAAEEVRELADGQIVQDRHRLVHADGRLRWFSRRLTPFQRDEHGRVTHHLSISRDITDVVQAEEQIRHAALHDELTGLANRRHLREELSHALHDTGGGLAVLFCDLDGFKLVNDVHGHAAGDEVLAAVAARLRAAVRDGDVVGRIGGDEFVAIVHSCPPEDAAAAGESVAARIRAAMAAPVVAAGTTHPVSVSIGVSVPEHRAQFDEVIRAADAAMYRDKAAGRAARGGTRPAPTPPPA